MTEPLAVIITGAAGGIGSALCRSFAQAGYFVIGSDRSTSAKGQHDAFVEIELSKLVRDGAYRADRISALRGALDGRRLSTLVNNAATQILAGVDSLTGDDWQQTLDVNLLAPFFLTQALTAELEATHGSVINVSSIHTRLTKSGFVAYATSKAALEGLTRAMAVDLGGRVRINALAPAATDTDMLRAGFANNAEGFAELSAAHPIGRIASPEEVAQAAVFLASEQAGFITGTTLAVDGGISARLHDPA